MPISKLIKFTLSTIGAVILAAHLTSCSLFPKKIEYFQDKVHALPEPTSAHVELQKEAATYTAGKTLEALEASIHEGSSTNVVTPITEAHIVAVSLAGSLGKPSSPYTGPAIKLGAKLDRQDAKLDSKIEDFRGDNDKNAGKPIEGTGLIQVGYFTQILFLVIFIVIIWVVLKVVGLFNPAIAVGTNIVQGGAGAVGKVVGRGFTEMIRGGEKFKGWVDEEFEDPETAAKIKALFASAHKEEQSKDVQEIITKLTN